MTGHKQLDMLALFRCMCLEIVRMDHSKDIQNEYLIYSPPLFFLLDLDLKCI